MLSHLSDVKACLESQPWVEGFVSVNEVLNERVLFHVRERLHGDSTGCFFFYPLNEVMAESPEQFVQRVKQFLMNKE